jgi:hypothetical protein
MKISRSIYGFSSPSVQATSVRFVLVEGGGSKLGFGGENPEIYLWLDSSQSAHMRCFLLEGLA